MVNNDSLDVQDVALASEALNPGVRGVRAGKGDVTGCSGLVNAGLRLRTFGV